jgi:hypothetical protein
VAYNLPAMLIVEQVRPDWAAILKTLAKNRR